MCCSCVTGRPDKFIHAVCLLSAVAGESGTDTKLRTLRVMSMVREDGRAEMLRQAFHHVVQDGMLDMSGVLTRSNLGDLVFFLSSQLSANITWLG